MVKILMLGVNYNNEPKKRLYASTRSLVRLQRCLTEVPRYAYPIQDFKFLVDDAAERNVVLESSECRDVETFQKAEEVLQQVSQMVVHPGQPGRCFTVRI
jgi:hypothetical protein